MYIKNEKVVEIDEAIIALRSDGIIHVHYKENTLITVELQGKMYDIFIEMCGDNKYAFLFTASDFVSVTKEARDNALILEALYPGIATAVLTDSTAYKIIANFYVLVNKPKTPLKIFSNEEDAVIWLKQYL